MTPRDRQDEIEITLAMLAAGVAAFGEWDSEKEEVAAMIWAVLSRALTARSLGFDQADEGENVGAVR